MYDLDSASPPHVIPFWRPLGVYTFISPSGLKRGNSPDSVTDELIKFKLSRRGQFREPEVASRTVPPNRGAPKG